MLDETTCPVCGKEVGHLGPEWAVAHYLAHLVAFVQPPGFGMPPQPPPPERVDNIPPPTT